MLLGLPSRSSTTVPGRGAREDESDFHGVHFQHALRTEGEQGTPARYHAQMRIRQPVKIHGGGSGRTGRIEPPMEPLILEKGRIDTRLSASEFAPQ